MGKVAPGRFQLQVARSVASWPRRRSSTCPALRTRLPTLRTSSEDESTARANSLAAPSPAGSMHALGTGSLTCHWLLLFLVPSNPP